MASDYYEFRTEKGILTIRRKGGHWELRIYLYAGTDKNGIAIRSDYIDPAEAAFDAGRADFGMTEIDEMFRSVYVPSELQGWRTSPSVYQTTSRL